MNHNRLRAAIMGGLDGVVTLLLVVVGGLDLRSAFVVLLAGALSMAVAEYASVSSQRDSADSPIDFNPWDAAVSSLLAFGVGGGLMLLPLIPSGNHWDSFVWILAFFALFIGGSYNASSKYADIKAGLRLVLAGSIAVGITLLATSMIGV